MEKKILQELGLNEKETIIYLELLKEKSCTASKLAKLTKINRTTAYLELENLKELGLVSYIIKDSKRYFQAASPDKLIEILDTKKKKVESILPKLKGLHQSVEPFKIEVFEGKSGIKTFYNDILKTGGEVVAFGITGYAFEMLKYDFPHFIEKFKKAGIKAKYLANFDAKKELNKLPLGFVEIRYLPKKYTSEITTIIYKDKVAIQSLVENNIFVTVMTDKLLYEGYKNYFEFMWNSI
jgi:sugar-specific transcriptional regulator TrmB